MRLHRFVFVLFATGFFACGGESVSSAPASNGTMDASSEGGGRVPVAAALAGACELGLIAGVTPALCRGLDEYGSCAMDQCDLQSCQMVCSDFTACFAQADDGCTTCTPNDACDSCIAKVSTCALHGPCADPLECATPTTGGPCDKLEACCAMQPQPKADACKALVVSVSKLAGDPSCIGAMQDQDFLDNYPCTFN